ncbi:hypothetical protein A2617_00295 [Candidatus Daviesbacteria bacterium RIFOXYD1_FULL_41_10]|uniref:Methyltransferase domain-containing protein n=2 Tax=Candidatus Daviesiibacteriota TaxID=1752718 RepID=A0A1F5MZP3_9BACT|nr:MAG: hypothetical protein UU67_C0015G0010 [Candidatus Daviesbacteria bacterium GW2011_GWB1_41_5]OGE70857.1 MAG: hypothetical protein A2617_00295 [Candidatus Daviesbacteria bacterium RIFOXYD1_FULL_41_10]
MINSVFENIFKNRSWRGRESISGRGSDSDQTKYIVKRVPALFKKMSISTVLDIPCGDFNWMKNVDLNGIKYIGADIIEKLIKNNKDKYGKDNISFQYIDITEDSLPQVDLVLMRDFLVHLSYEDIFKTLNNIYRSGAKYLLTTSFTNRKENKDIITGGWQPLNLRIAPFFFPKPIKIINEKCTQGRLSYTDKSLALWEIAELYENLL